MYDRIPVVEIEPNVLQRDGKGSFESKEKVAAYIGVWQRCRNDKEVKARWLLTNKEERVKLTRLHPLTSPV